MLRRCRGCRFAFVEDPWTEYEKIYDAAYYEGRGADPLIDYHYELAEPHRAIRGYEWAGIVQVVAGLAGLDKRTRWLDFGCGNGGLVRHAAEAVGCQIVGFEQGGCGPRSMAGLAAHGFEPRRAGAGVDRAGAQAVCGARDSA